MTPVYPPGGIRGNVEDTLRELMAEGLAERATISKAHELEDVEKLVRTFVVADERILEKQFRGRPDAGDLTGDLGAFLHLPLVTDTTPVMHPILTFAYDWPRSVLRLRVAMFTAVPHNEGRRLRAVGFRFETPECWAAGGDVEPAERDPGGHHDMFHAQPLTRLHPASPRTALPGLRWINTIQPSIPVSAEDPSGLLLALLVAIYGRRRVVERQRERKLQALNRSASQVSGLPRAPRRPDP